MKKKFFIITTVPISLMFFKGQIQVLKKIFDIKLISSPEEKLYQVGEEESVEVYPIKMSREISLFNDLLSLYRLLVLFRKTSPTVIHGNTPKAGLLSMIAGWITKVPTRIYYIHGLRYEGLQGYKKRILELMEKLSCSLATDVFVVSQGVKKKLINDRIMKGEINIIGNGSVNGIDIDFFSPEDKKIPNVKSNYSIKKDNFIFGFVGRLVGDKGINELVDAFEKVNEKFQHARLVLVGEFEEKLDPIAETTKYKIKNNQFIIHVGFQKDIRVFLKMMDVFVFPSHREGFGVSLMEAAAMGVPAISSDITGCNEIIQDSYNGILIPAKSVVHLENAMKKCISDVDYTRRLSSVARQFVIDKYEQVELWDKTLEAYMKVLKIN